MSLLSTPVLADTSKRAIRPSKLNGFGLQHVADVCHGVIPQEAVASLRLPPDMFHRYVEKGHLGRALNLTPDEAKRFFEDIRGILHTYYDEIPPTDDIAMWEKEVKNSHQQRIWVA